jgi:hypothetical protein
MDARMQNPEPTPTQTIKIIDKLREKNPLFEETFRQMHHMGDSSLAFQKYCSGISGFRLNSRNRELHDKLRRMLDEA